MAKVLLVNNGYPSVIQPHYSAYIRNIKECFESAGCDVELLVMSSDFRSLTGKFLCYINFYLQILFYKKFGEFDIVVLNHFPHFSLPFLLKLNKIKQIIIHWHGGDLLPEGKLKKKIFLWLHKILLKRNPDILHISPSVYFAAELTGSLDIEKGSITISPSGGVRSEYFTPVHSGTNEKIRIGFASGLIKEKGAELLIELIKCSHELENLLNIKLEFHYIYYGKEKEKYTIFLQKITNAVKWNVLKAEEMSSFYNSIDILLFPTEGESLGLVALEAMCCDKPVIGTNKSALPEYIIPGFTGETFEYNNLNSLKKSLIKCIQNITSYKPRKLILEKYSRGSVVTQYKELLKIVST